MSIAPTFNEVVAAQVRVALGDVHTAMPGRVTSYDRLTQTCSVQPLLKRRRSTEDGSTEQRALPELHRVPVDFQGAGEFSITFPLAAGDTVLLLFFEQSTDEWVQGGGLVDQRDPRRFALSDAVAIPGLRSVRDAVAGLPVNALTIAAPTGAEIRIGSVDAADPVVRRSDLASVVGRLEGHTHAGGTLSNSGGSLAGFSATPTGSYSTPACSTKVMIE